MDKDHSFLSAYESDTNMEIPGKDRFVMLPKIISSIPVPKSILDVGGTLATARWLHDKFPNACVTVLNSSKKEIASYKYHIIADAQSFHVKKKFDLIFCGEIIEHMYNPDGFLHCCYKALQSNGSLIITTPNLSCFYNRIFLLFGWSLGNYSPSLRFNTGNPFMNLMTTDFGIIGDHKSVFTYSGLRELLAIHGFRTVKFRGFHYSQTKPLRTLKKSTYVTPLAIPRLFLNAILPHQLREGMIFICRKGKVNPFTENTVLKTHFWDM